MTLASLAQHVGILGFLKMSERWHRAGSHALLHHPRYSWPNLVNEVVAPNGFTLVPLSNSLDLAEEGTAMHHCVGGYGPYCVQGESRVYSIRDETNQRMSTLEVRIRKGSEPQLRIAQNYARFNLSPALKAQEAAKWFVEEVNTGRLNANWAAVEKAGTMAAENTLCGFDVQDNEAWNREYAAISHCLPTALSVASPQAYLERINYKAFLQQCVA